MMKEEERGLKQHIHIVSKYKYKLKQHIIKQHIKIILFKVKWI